MTRPKLVTIALGALLGAAAALLTPAPAHCAFCMDVECMYTSNCFKGCACLKSGSLAMGRCVSFE